LFLLFYQDGYSWSITFHDGVVRDHPTLVATSSLLGTGAAVGVVEQRKGNWLGGSFGITFKSQHITVPFDVSPSALKRCVYIITLTHTHLLSLRHTHAHARTRTHTHAHFRTTPHHFPLLSCSTLEAFSSIGTLEVTMSGPDIQRGRVWFITFVDDTQNPGNVDPLVVVPTGTL
jgi:hypothetical protein